MPIKSQNNLKKTRTYLAGSMEFSDGTQWRIDACKKLEALGVTCLNPYEDFFLGKISETGLHERIREIRSSGDYESLETIAGNVREFDLAAVAKSDFIIAYINTDVFCFGTIEEISRAIALNKPVYVFVEQSKQNAPFWLFGLVGEKYIFNNIQEIFDKLYLVNQDVVACDSDKWSLLVTGLR